MATSTPIVVTEMATIPANGPADRIVARFASWDDAAAFALAASKNDGATFYHVRFDDGMTVATCTFLRGIAGEQIQKESPAVRKARRARNADIARRLNPHGYAENLPAVRAAIREADCPNAPHPEVGTCGMCGHVTRTAGETARPYIVR